MKTVIILAFYSLHPGKHESKSQIMKIFALKLVHELIHHAAVLKSERKILTVAPSYRLDEMFFLQTAETHLIFYPSDSIYTTKEKPIPFFVVVQCLNLYFIHTTTTKIEIKNK